MNLVTQNNIVDLNHFSVLCKPELKTLHTIFKKYGYEIRVAGGAVRDMLLNKEPHDIDFATNATPDQMTQMFITEGIRTINRNGEAHGTVTPRINNCNFEVTTLRIDVKPDGRHSEVEFTQDWVLDAARRDLTVNSMFLCLIFKDDGKEQNTNFAAVDGAVSSPVSHQVSGLVGELFDYFGGRLDLQERRIRFVGDAAQRIREDYLRVLRYFRFHGALLHSDRADDHDPDTLQAIRENSDGIASISGERIWLELQRILLFDSAPQLIQRMIETGVLRHIGLPVCYCSGVSSSNSNAAPEMGSVDMDPLAEMKLVYAVGANRVCTQAATCLASLVRDDADLEGLISRLRISNLEVDIITYIVHNRRILRDILTGDTTKCLVKICDDDGGTTAHNNLSANEQRLLAYLKHELLTGFREQQRQKRITGECLAYVCGSGLAFASFLSSTADLVANAKSSSTAEPAILTAWQAWQPPRMPVTGAALATAWNLSRGPKIGHQLAALRRIWAGDACRMTEEQLLSDEIRQRIELELSIGGGAGVDSDEKQGVVGERFGGQQRVPKKQRRQVPQEKKWLGAEALLEPEKGKAGEEIEVSLQKKALISPNKLKESSKVKKDVL